MAPRECVKRYPRITAHLIHHSQGLVLPIAAAQILLDARVGRPVLIVQSAIRNRHQHRRDPLNYETAQYVVQRFIETGEEPCTFVWFE